MRVVVLYRPNSEHSRVVESFIHDYQFEHGDSTNSRLETISVDTRDGVATASLYDVMVYPAILVLADDGMVIKSWIGGDLPRMADVAGYAFSF